MMPITCISSCPPVDDRVTNGISLHFGRRQAKGHALRDLSTAYAASRSSLARHETWEIYLRSGNPKCWQIMQGEIPGREPGLNLHRIELVSNFGSMSIYDIAAFREKKRKDPNHREPYSKVSFHRTELNIILSTYGRMVAAGQWRDYGISSLSSVAVFSVFRHASECPLYRIEKWPSLASKQGMYLIRSMDDRILRRGHNLQQVMRWFDRSNIGIVS